MKQDQYELYDVVVDYTYALDTLDDYDYESLAIEKTTKGLLGQVTVSFLNPINCFVEER